MKKSAEKAKPWSMKDVFGSKPADEEPAAKEAVAEKKPAKTAVVEENVPVKKAAPKKKAAGYVKNDAAKDSEVENKPGWHRYDDVVPHHTQMVDIIAPNQHGPSEFIAQYRYAMDTVPRDKDQSARNGDFYINHAGSYSAYPPGKVVYWRERA